MLPSFNTTSNSSKRWHHCHLLIVPMLLIILMLPFALNVRKLSVNLKTCKAFKRWLFSFIGGRIPHISAIFLGTNSNISNKYTYNNFFYEVHKVLIELIFYLRYKSPYNIEDRTIMRYECCCMYFSLMFFLALKDLLAFKVFSVTFIFTFSFL